MDAVKFRTHVGSDGILKLEIPVGITNVDYEVVITPRPTLSRNEWLAFIDRTAGSLADDPIERPPQGEYDVREPLE
jgi:hypothetical protein